MIGLESIQTVESNVPPPNSNPDLPMNANPEDYKYLYAGTTVASTVFPILKTATEQEVAEAHKELQAEVFLAVYAAPLKGFSELRKCLLDLIPADKQAAALGLVRVITDEVLSEYRKLAAEPEEQSQIIVPGA